MLISTPDFTPINSRPLLTQTVRTVRTLDKNVFGLGSARFPLNERVSRLLNEFKRLETNWDEDGALPPSSTVIRQAENLVDLLQIAGQKVYHIAPGPNGEIMIDLRENGNSVEILIYPTYAKFVRFPVVGSPTQGEFDDHQLPNILKWLHEKTEAPR